MSASFSLQIFLQRCETCLRLLSHCLTERQNPSQLCHKRVTMHSHPFFHQLPFQILSFLAIKVALNKNIAIRLVPSLELCTWNGHLLLDLLVTYCINFGTKDVARLYVGHVRAMKFSFMKTENLYRHMDPVHQVQNQTISS